MENVGASHSQLYKPGIAHHLLLRLLPLEKLLLLPRELLLLGLLSRRENRW